MAVFKGDASCFVTSSLGGTRRFSLRTVNSDGTPTDRSTWQLDAGGSVTLYFRTEGTGPDAPTTVTLRVYYETGTALLIRTLVSGASPSTGTSYTFYGTDNGLVGGSPRAGMVRLFVQAIRTGSTGGTNDYNITSDDTANTRGTLLSDDGGDQGALRVRCLCTDLTVSAYPTGSTFAIGPLADESFTLTLTHTQKYADRNLETVQFRVLTSSNAIIEAGPTQEFGAGTTTQAAFVADMTYPQTPASYGGEVTSLGNSALLPTEKWTELVDNGANLTQVDAFTVRRASFFNVDTTVSAILFTSKSNAVDANKVPTGALSQQFFVGADVCYFNTRVANARGEYLDGMAVQLLVKLAGTNEQGPLTGLQTQTSSSRLGWLSSATPFYTVNVIAPAAQRVLSVLYTRGSFSLTQTTTITFSPAYTGNLQLNVGVFRAAGSDSIRVLADPILLDGTTQLLLSQGTPVGVLDATPRAYLYEVGATGAPVYVDDEVCTRVTGGSDDHWVCTFSGLDDSKQYFVSIAAAFNGGQVARNMTVPKPVTGHTLTDDEYALLALGGDADALHHHGTYDALGTADAGVDVLRVSGAPASEYAWEEALSDPQVDSEALADQVVEGLPALFGEEEVVTVIDSRSPDAFTEGANYVLDNDGRDPQGTFVIVQKETVPTAGGDKTKLTLGRIRTTILTDQDRQQRRQDTADRFL